MSLAGNGRRIRASGGKLLQLGIPTHSRAREAAAKIPPMLLDRETWTSAQAMIRHYGPEARAQAGMRAAGFAAEGDSDGQREWIRIIQAITWLQDQRPGSTLRH